MKRTLLAVSVIAFLLAACGGDEPTKPKVDSLNIAGTWTGTGLTTDNRVVSFELQIRQAGTTLSGNANAKISGSLVSTDYEITGYLLNSGEFSILLRTVVITYAGIASNSILSGKIKGGSLQERDATFIKK